MKYVRNPYAPKNCPPNILQHSIAIDKEKCLRWSEGRADRILGKEQNKVYRFIGAYIEGWESVDPR